MLRLSLNKQQEDWSRVAARAVIIEKIIDCNKLFNLSKVFVTYFDSSMVREWKTHDQDIDEFLMCC